MADIVYSDINYQVRINAQGNVDLVTNLDSVSQSILTILSTYPGERIMNPEFGSRVRDLLFEPIDDITASFIEEEIKESIFRWEDRVNIQAVQVIPNEDENRYAVRIAYTVITTNQTDEFVGTLSSLS